ncbi:MAG TPA: ATPase, T2SS/T4P/T4SS family [Candidatus Nanoarchaeia archaeon]|nr:ATPase, T2SS/T4P/T4SS family [Candidatus Nanoarchaeia archaeon]
MSLTIYTKPSQAVLVRLVTAVLSPTQQEMLADEGEVDCSHTIGEDLERRNYRLNVIRSESGLCLTARVVPTTIRELSSISFPTGIVKRVTQAHSGLVLVVGPTGSGKTTTCSSFLDHFNAANGYRISTVEDPIEYIIHPKKSVITQREVGRHARSFAGCVRSAMRQDPDILFVGEIRDAETADAAAQAAETGHLVVATMHTHDVKGTIYRFVDLYPDDLRKAASAKLGSVLLAVIAQRLLPYARAGKRALNTEIMTATTRTRNAVVHEKLADLDNALLTCRADDMITFGQHLRILYDTKEIDALTAKDYATSDADRMFYELEEQKVISK